jgi:hypothetical protein
MLLAARWLCLVTLTLALAATAQEGERPAPTTGGRRFVHPGALYSFVVPPGWTAEVLSGERAVAAAEPGQGGGRLDVEIRGADSRINLRGVADYSDSRDYRHSTFEDITVGGRKALRVTYRPWKDAPSSVERVLEVFVRNNRDDVLVFTFTAAEWTRERPAFDRLLATLRFSALPRQPPAGSYLLSGLITNRTGNCMPVVRPGQCVDRPVQRKVFIREPASSDALGFMGTLEKKTPLVVETQSGSDGRYEVFLPAGRYSVFVEAEGRELCNEGMGACLVEIQNRNLRRDIRMRHQATF